MKKDKKNDSTKHLENVFMNTPVVSVTESTGSSDFIWETTFDESPENSKEKHDHTTKTKKKR